MTHFRIKPSKDSDYMIYFHIFETKKDMYLYNEKKLVIDEERDYDGICIPFEVIKNVDTPDEYKTAESHVCLHKKQSGIGVVSHEICHAVIDFMREKYGRDFNLGRETNELEEEFCSILENVQRKFCLKAYEKKIWA